MHQATLNNRKKQFNQTLFHKSKQLNIEIEYNYNAVSLKFFISLGNSLSFGFVLDLFLRNYVPI